LQPASPYKDLFIYHLEGRLKPVHDTIFQSYIGNWQEEESAFLFFSAPAPVEIQNILASQPQLRFVDSYQMPYEQWQGEQIEAFDQGTFRIIPSWQSPGNDGSDNNGKVNILLDPGVVFGAGKHPTTNDCLDAIEMVAARFTPGTALDLGTGTGLLALAAVSLGCNQTLAVDLNLLAAITAEKNVRLNHLQEKILVVQGYAENLIECPADLVIANIHYSIMVKLIKSNGFHQKKLFILSGLLRSEAKHIASMLAQQKVKIIKQWTTDGIWHTFYGVNNQFA